jgi:hypothetical protein
MFGILGLVIYHWKGFENNFPMVYYTPQKFKNLQLQNGTKKSMVV